MCVPPLDSLLTSGLMAGVLVMAVVAIVVIGALARGGARLLRDDAADARDAAGRDVPTHVADAGGPP